MSGCHTPTETKSVCEHSKPVTLLCVLCAPKYQEFTMLDVINALNDLREKIKSLYIFKINQFDENVNISKRFDEIEKSIQEMRGLSLHPTRPYKCPVCDGIGIDCIIGEVRGLPIKTDKCKPCDGKGIVWG